jgi:hypothetical protein
MTTTNDNNKALVLAGIKGVFIDRDPTVLDRLFRDDYRQHNPQTAPPRSRRSWETSLAAAVRRCPLGVIRDQSRASDKRDHVRYAPIATEFRSAGKCRDGPIGDIVPSPRPRARDPADIPHS